jgi:hypothetical protein
MTQDAPGSFERHIANEYMKTLKDLPARPQFAAGDHALDKTDAIFSHLVGQGIYNLALMGLRLREERAAATATQPT